MGTYILRRILLMIPTLIGITFLVFMLVALSPGGIGASLKFTAGGQMDQTSAAVQQAYLEDRYGLDDPPVVQYVRWLGRISPIKFGTRDQVAPDGERIATPKELKPPPLWSWFADELPVEPVAEPFAWPTDDWAEQGLTDEQIAFEKSQTFRGVTNEYARARAAYIGAKARFEQAAAHYAKSPEVDLSKAVASDGTLKDRVLRRAAPERSAPAWPELAQAGRAMLDAYARAQQARAAKLAVFRARPYPQAGVGIVPGLSLASPDFGVSFSRSRPVMDLVKEALPVTLLINLMAFPIIYLVAIPSGMLAAVRQGGLFDLISGASFIALLSFPIMLAGVLAIGYLANQEHLGWFPVSGLSDAAADAFTFLPSVAADGSWQRGWLVDRLWHIALPVACLTYGGFAVLAKQTRAAMLDNFSADYVRTAKAKGVSRHDVIFRHVFRNSLLPLITIFVTIFPAMLSGSVVVESIFTIPGMGKLTLDAINLRDRELVLANALMIGGLNLVALLLADILYAFADPRISYD